MFKKYCLLACCAALSVSCVKDLLNHEHPTQLSSGIYWNTVSDAENALNGVYAAVRGCFDRDYLFDGHAEYSRTRQTYVDDYDASLSYSENLFNGCAYFGSGGTGSSAWNPDNYGEYDRMYEFLYGGVNRANFVIDNVTEMLKDAKEIDQAKLETILAEARLLRGMCYFRLITMWGDVPYIGETVKSPQEVAHITRTPIGEVFGRIIDDFTYAAGKLPDKRPLAEWGRATKPAALAFRGKANLYWASWKKNGWTELAGFKQDADEARKAFQDAINDFGIVIDNFGLTLYKNGAPGEWGEMGRADVLPNYYHLFTAKANGDPEFIFVFNHGGPRTDGYRNQGEQLMRAFAGRGHQNSQLGVMPRFEVGDRYQLITTGDFAPFKLEPIVNLTNNEQYVRTNSARNPQSYVDRDYRMKASILWDFEVSMGFTDLKATGYAPWLYYVSSTPITQKMVDDDTYRHFTQWHVGLTTNGAPTSQTRTGYIYRKFVRDDDEQLYRNEGAFNWPVMRLADVYLMYAEADNELNGPQAKAIDLVNKIRARGALPALAAAKTAGYQEFFDAIEQERIIELLAEGQRCFDIRRWRALERIFGAPNTPSDYFKDTRNENEGRFFHNANELRYMRNYICRIPQKERDRNPNLTQNTPWL